MSTISLGKLITDIQYNESYDNYVAAIIDSQSGYEYPKLIRKATELNAFYGEFSYDKMYRELIDNDIPVLLLPQLTVASQYNKCTLRISRDGDTYKLCNPRYGKSYEYHQVNESGVSGTTYNQVLDFDEVEYEDMITNTPENIPCLIIAQDKSGAQGLRQDNRLIQFSDDTEYVGEFSNYWSGTKKCILSSGTPSNKIDLLYKLKYAIKGQDGTEDKIVDCIDVIDEVSELLNTVINEFDCSDLISINNQRDVVNNELEEINSEIDALDPADPDYRMYLEVLMKSRDEKLNQIQELNDQLDSFVERLYKYLAKEIYTHEFLTEDPNNIDAVVKNTLFNQSRHLFSSFKDPNNVNDMIYTSIEFFIENSVSAVGSPESGSIDQLNRNRLALRYVNPVVAPYFTNIKGLVTYSKSFYDNDRLVESTENRKLIEFYSKIKGDRGECTKISIAPYGDKDQMVYQIDVINGDIFESFTVSTIPPLSGFAYYDPDEYKYIESINQDSQLIGLRFFNYYDSVNDTYLSPDEVDIDFTELTDEEISDLANNFQSRGLPSTSTLDESGYISLGRYLNEYPSSEDIFDTLDVLNDSDWYPDLFLVTELNSSDNAYYLDKINEYCVNHKTQALIKVDEHNITSYSGGFTLNTDLFTRHLKSINGSRLLTFFEDIRIDDVSYPCFYPYIPNILHSKFLEIPQDRLIYDRIPRKFTRIITEFDENYDPIEYNYDEDKLPIIDEELLKSMGINYFDYNNLYYNYKAIREINPSPDFHVIYCTSKISRTFLDNSDDLINCDQREFEGKVSDLIRKAKNLLPLVDDVTYSYNFNGNQYNIEVSVTITKLVNKKFIFNITLNIT